MGNSVFQDGKIQFHKTIKRIQQERLNDPAVTLESFIISPTLRSSIQHWADGSAPSDFLENHIVFMYDEPDDYIDQMLKGESVFTQGSLPGVG